MRKIVAGIGIILFVVLVTACTYKDMMDKLVPKQEAKTAEDILSRFRAKDIEFIKSKLSPELKQKANDELLYKVSGYFRTGDLISTTLIGSQVNIINGVWHGNFSFEYKFSNGWNLANAAFKKVNDDYQIIGLNVYQTEMSQKELNAFGFSDKDLKHYLMFAIAVVVPLFILVTTYFCIRTPIPKRKWLWVIFVLVGIFSVHLNWTTGQVNIQPFSVNLFGAAAMAASPYSPWIITASFPLGAIMFWFKRRRFIESKDISTGKVGSQ